MGICLRYERLGLCSPKLRCPVGSALTFFCELMWCCRRLLHTHDINNSYGNYANSTNGHLLTLRESATTFLVNLLVVLLHRQLQGKQALDSVVPSTLNTTRARIHADGLQGFRSLPWSRTTSLNRVSILTCFHLACGLRLFG